MSATNNYVYELEVTLAKASQSALDSAVQFLRNHADNKLDAAQLDALAAIFNEFKATLTPKKPAKGKAAAKAAAAAGGDAPARKPSISGYALFSKEKRPTVVAENPGMATTDVMKQLGAAWKALSDEDRNAFNERAKALNAAAAAAPADAAAAPAAPAAAAPAAAASAPADQKKAKKNTKA
jgi:hypothetical protein